MVLTLLSVSDRRYHVKVAVQERGITVFKDEYTIEEAAPADADRNPAGREQRAYRMTNRLIETMMGDPRFKKAITGS